jgi:GMP synthase-like glutamine amidotransferase
MKRKLNRRISPLILVQHHIAEGPGEVKRWAEQRSVDVTLVRPDLNERLPLGGVPVVLLGGPYSVLDDRNWLQREREWVRELVATGTPVFGICLGAQLLAEALGASVFVLPQSETGWTPVRFTDGHTLDVLQWHDESFTMPSGATLHGSTDLCANQYFSVGEKLVGLQFHPEWNADSVSELNFSYGSACPVLRGDTSDARRHHAASAWFHGRLDRWFKCTSTSSPSLRHRQQAWE